MMVLFLVDKTLCLYAPCGCYGDLSIYSAWHIYISHIHLKQCKVMSVKFPVKQ